jgi:hypothetical protein
VNELVSLGCGTLDVSELILVFDVRHIEEKQPRQDSLGEDIAYSQQYLEGWRKFELAGE